MDIIKTPRELNNLTIVSVIKSLEGFYNKDDDSECELNFSDTYFAFPGAITPLLAYLKEKTAMPQKLYLNSKGSHIDNYIRRMGFYSLLGLQDNYFWNKWSGKGRFQEPYYFSKNTKSEEVTEKSDNIIKTFIKNRLAKNYNEAIGWCINEIIDNAHTHSNSDINVIMAQSYDRITKFCVADRGVGMRATIGCSDIKTALEECITKTKGINSDGMGNGLYYTAELIKKDTSGECSMSIWSEDYILTLYSSSKPEIKKVEGFWQGVNISISMYNGISTSLSALMNGRYSFSYDNMPEYYENLFEN